MTPLTQLKHTEFQRRKIQVWIKREDLNHPLFQGNKRNKLIPNIRQAKNEGKSTLISFGGAYSNHIAALANLSKRYRFKTVGFIRGDELENNPKNWSRTILKAKENGMCLKFLDRNTYRKRHESGWLEQLKNKYPDAYIIPEGGTNKLAISGFKSLASDMDKQLNWDTLFCPVGTGGTLAGLICHSQFNKRRKIIGVPALKQSQFLEKEITQWLDPKEQYNDWFLLNAPDNKRYAKTSNNTKQAQHWFEYNFKIKLDPIYTNKMVYAFLKALKNDQIQSNSKVILLHTGGLQGCDEKNKFNA